METLSTTMVKPRLAFVGVGWIGMNRLRALTREECAEAALIADPNRNAVRSALELAPNAATSEDLESVLRSDVDGVVLATPSGMHFEQAIRALEAGKHVFCQKPLGRTADETGAVLAAARRADRLLGIDFCYRHAEAMQAVRDVVRSGQIGDVFAADLVFHNAYGPDKSWALDARLAGGGCLIDLGIHLVDLLHWTLDDARVLRVDGAHYREGARLRLPADEIEDYASAELDLDTGARVRLACSWHFSIGCDALIEASFHGTSGSATFRNVDGSFYDFQAVVRRGSDREVLVSPPDDWGGRAITAWARRLETDAGYDPAVESVVEVARTLDRIYGREDAARNERAGRREDPARTEDGARREDAQ